MYVQFRAGTLEHGNAGRSIETSQHPCVHLMIDSIAAPQPKNKQATTSYNRFEGVMKISSSLGSRICHRNLGI